MNVFSDPIILKTVEGYKEALRLSSICSYDFDSLLQLFKPVEGLDKEKQPEIKYSPCRGVDIETKLRDLFFVSADYRPTSTGAKFVSTISSFSNETEILVDKVIEQFVHLQELLETAFSSEHIGNIIKMASLNPLASLETEKIELSVVPQLKEDLLARYNKARKAYAKQIKEAVYLKKVYEVFEDYPLLLIDGYSTNNSNQLTNADLPPFRYITPLRLMKSYFEHFYQEKFQGVFRGLGERVEFVSEHFGSEYTNAVDTLATINDAIYKFEEDITNPEYSKLLPLLKKIAEIGLSLEETGNAKKAITAMNNRADSLINGGTKVLDNLVFMCNEILNDLKHSDSIIVENIHYMRNREGMLIRDLEEAMDTTNRFLELMKIFIIDPAKARKKLAEKND
jgi:predicted transcriptional regulator